MVNKTTYTAIINLKHGKITALEKLYKKHYAKLFSFAKKFSFTTLTADDIVQQTFLKIWENRSQLKDQVSFEKQLYTISKNTIINQLKRENRFFSFDDITLVAESEDHKEQKSEESESKLNWLYEKIAEMPARRREIFELHKLQGLSHLEISKKLNISKSTISNHLYLAMAFLKKERKNYYKSSS
ncbi:MAG: RNA polymerase sigma factor [Tenacibaculum sp.]